ncbi:MAG: hypothetical protein A2Z37_04380 [Chloroflexi bacterium RBG_19FT_COMBO_62_14]|nr:MAG: hypothetical protein A2Z37_04380 [Chloroflexi bacterium RBG_19FT_COMBO_62_14]
MYIPPEIQGTIVRALKPLIFDGLPVVIIAIPHRRYDALKVEKEMTGRIGPIDIPVWSLDELRFISHTGFRLLNCELPASVGTTFAEEAIGSPHLMQEFCRGICRLLGIDESIPAPDTLQFKVPLIKTVTRGYAIQGVSRGELKIQGATSNSWVLSYRLETAPMRWFCVVVVILAIFSHGWLRRR